MKFAWKPAPPLSVEDYRRRARRKVPDMVWAYVDGGSDDMATLRENRDAFADWDLRARCLTGNEGTGLGVEFAGRHLDLPVFLCPTGMTGLAHWTGEAAAARAAESAGTTAVISTSSSYTPEEIAAVTDRPHTFQLYAATDPRTGTREMTEGFLRRARNAGFTALAVTVDVPVHGNREREKRTGMGVPPTLRPRGIVDGALHPGWAWGFVRHGRTSGKMLVDGGGRGPVRGAKAGVESVKQLYRVMRPELNWDDFSWMRDQWKGPLSIKGVLDPEDAAIAVDRGADAVWVSNHGGRQLDGARAAVRALPAVVDRVGDRVPVYLDSGIRRGTDVVKALALGATAVGIGRPYIYGLAADGERGVRGVLEILRQEISRTLTLMGVADVQDLTRDHVVPRHSI